MSTTTDLVASVICQVSLVGLLVVTMWPIVKTGYALFTYDEKRNEQAPKSAPKRPQLHVPVPPLLELKRMSWEIIDLRASLAPPYLNEPDPKWRLARTNRKGLVQTFLRFAHEHHDDPADRRSEELSNSRTSAIFKIATALRHCEEAESAIEALRNLPRNEKNTQGYLEAMDAFKRRDLEFWTALEAYQKLLEADYRRLEDEAELHDLPTFQ